MNSIWVMAVQWGVIFLNLYGVWLSRKTRIGYWKMSEKADEQIDRIREHVDNVVANYEFHIAQLAEENELLRTNVGLYELRDDPEKYQMYLELLRKKD